MSAAETHDPVITATHHKTLPGLPRGPLAPQQRLEALRRVQAQADQRVKLGMQLFKAAEAHTARHVTLLDQVKQEQAKLRQQVREEIAGSLSTYEERLTGIDQSVTDSVRKLEDKM